MVSDLEVELWTCVIWLLGTSDSAAEGRGVRLCTSAYTDKYEAPEVANQQQVTALKMERKYSKFGACYM